MQESEFVFCDGAAISLWDVVRVGWAMDDAAWERAETARCIASQTLMLSCFLMCLQKHGRGKHTPHKARPAATVTTKTRA